MLGPKDSLWSKPRHAGEHGTWCRGNSQQRCSFKETWLWVGLSSLCEIQKGTNLWWAKNILQPAKQLHWWTKVARPPTSLLLLPRDIRLRRAERKKFKTKTGSPTGTSVLGDVRTALLPLNAWDYTESSIERCESSQWQAVFDTSAILLTFLFI